METNKIKTSKNSIVSEKIIESILSEIRNGKLKPGEKLEGQRGLAKKYKVGMSSIREALSALSILNIVEIEQGKGAFVSQLSPKLLVYPLKFKIPLNKKEIINFYEVRNFLDISAVEIVIKEATDKEIAEIGEILENMERYMTDIEKDGNVEKYVAEDIRFHRTIYKLTRNEILVLLIEFLNKNILDNLGVYFSNVKSSRKFHETHKNIFKKIVARDVQGAKKYFIQLRNDTIKVVISLITE